MLKSKETQFLTNMMFPNTAISNKTGIHGKCVCMYCSMTVSTAMTALSCCIKVPILVWPQGIGQTECHVIFKSLNHKPFGEGIKCQLYCTQDPEFKWLPITCTLLTNDCGGHSVFPTSHCVSNAVDFQYQRVKPSPKSCIFMRRRICMKL